MKSPKAINLFLDSYDQICLFSDEQAGRLIKALLLYGKEGKSTEFSDDLALKFAFCTMSKQIDRDFEKYNEICEKRSKAGRSGAQALRTKNDRATANADKCRQEEDEEEKEDKKENEYEDEDEHKDKAQSAARQIIPLEFIFDVQDIVDHLNKRAGTDYRPSTFSIAKLITDRLKAGFTAEQCMRAVDSGVKELRAEGVKDRMLPFFLFGRRFEKFAGVSES